MLAGAAPVAVDGVGGDADLLGDGLRAAQLLEEEADLALQRLGRLASEANTPTSEGYLTNQHES